MPSSARRNDLPGNAFNGESLWEDSFGGQRGEQNVGIEQPRCGEAHDDALARLGTGPCGRRE